MAHEENHVLVLALVVQDPRLSSREVSRELQMRKISMSIILHKKKFPMYHVHQLVQEPDQTDSNNRLQFSNGPYATEFLF